MQENDALLGINFSRQRLFNPEWAPERRFIYAKIVLAIMYNGVEFDLSHRGLMKEFGLGRRKVEANVDFFVENGFISQVDTEKGAYKRYKAHVDVFTKKFDLIYDLSWIKDPHERKEQAWLIANDLQMKLTYTTRRLAPENAQPVTIPYKYPDADDIESIKHIIITEAKPHDED